MDDEQAEVFQAWAWMTVGKISDAYNRAIEEKLREWLAAGFSIDELVVVEYPSKIDFDSYTYLYRWEQPFRIRLKDESDQFSELP